MKIINAEVSIADPLLPESPEAILKKIETIGRSCYRSEEYITSESASKFVRRLIRDGHEAMLEHVSISVKFIVDRGVSHEIVRHRVASYAQESTRYCNYSKDKFGSEITVIQPYYLLIGTPEWTAWFDSCKAAEKAYFEMLDDGRTPQEARAVLPNSLKTKLWMTANLREWRHFLKLRAVGTTGKPHPQMAEVAVKLLQCFKAYLPDIFYDIDVEE